MSKIENEKEIIKMVLKDVKHYNVKVINDALEELQ